jgi:hypothetical protein
MPAYRTKMLDQERWQLVHYVRHLSLKMGHDPVLRNSLTDDGFSTSPRLSTSTDPSRASNQLERSLPVVGSFASTPISIGS